MDNNLLTKYVNLNILIHFSLCSPLNFKVLSSVQINKEDYKDFRIILNSFEIPGIHPYAYQKIINILKFSFIVIVKNYYHYSFGL